MELEPPKRHDFSGVSDEQREMASRRQLTVKPVNSSISPEELSDEAIINRHLRDGPIAGSPSENELTQSPRGLNPFVNLELLKAPRLIYTIMFGSAILLGIIAFIIVAFIL